MSNDRADTASGWATGWDDERPELGVLDFVDLDDAAEAAAVGGARATVAPPNTPSDAPPADDAALIEVLAALPPGPQTLLALDAVDLNSLDEAARVRALVVWERQHRWLTACTQQALVAAAGSRPTDRAGADSRIDEDITREEIACALGWSNATAAARLHQARTLHTLLPATLAQVTTGALSWRHALVLLDVVEQTGPDSALLDALQARVLPGGSRQTAPEFRRAVRRALAALRPEELAIAHEAAKAERAVRMWPERNGMATLAALLPAAEAQAAYNALDRLARHNAGACDDNGCRLGIDARRADALLGRILGDDAGEALDQRSTAGGSTRRPVADVQVLVDLATLLQLADHPAELLGYGPIPAHVARQLAADSGWQRWVHDPVTGHLLDCGRRTYRPPEALARFVAARDQTCRFPGCGQPAIRCDIDHRRPWRRGGTTCACNCGPLCRRHHRLKTHHGWRLEVRDDGTLSWISPRGLRYDHGPPRLPTLQTWAAFDPLPQTAPRQRQVATGNEEPCPF